MSIPSFHSLLSSVALLAIVATPIQAESTPNAYLSLKLEAERAFTQAVPYLQAQQQPEGYWGDENTPALTALALTAILRDPNFDREAPLPEWLTRGFDFLRQSQKSDGGIYGKGLATYNTSTSIMAFVSLGDQIDEPLLLKARAFLINQQTDWGNKGETDDTFDGGIGYGGTYAHSDMSNTYLALEALYHTKHLANDANTGTQPQLNWEAALRFISRCQNLTETNDQEFASDDEENKGGFIYFPGSSKAGEQDLGEGQVALRSYGSMSYAGLLSFIYADLQKDDPRVEAVTEWLGKNYTLEENPGLGLQGLYYYYQTLTKALVAADFRKLPLHDGSEADWRADLSKRLLSSQREDGSWVNSNSRWWENDPVLVTSYSLLALAQIHAVL